MNKKYDSKFYSVLLTEEFVYSAHRILEIILNALPPVKSVLDVGCSAGTWLQDLKENRNMERTKGIDSKWVDRKYLAIPDEDFIEADLSKTFPDLKERFDLAISLEVAEHLPLQRAEDFVNYLTRLSDFVLFSAVIPFQGGTNHFNEQWQDYWREKLMLSLVHPQQYEPTSKSILWRGVLRRALKKSFQKIWRKLTR